VRVEGGRQEARGEGRSDSAGKDQHLIRFRCEESDPSLGRSSMAADAPSWNLLAASPPQPHPSWCACPRCRRRRRRPWCARCPLPLASCMPSAARSALSCRWERRGWMPSSHAWRQSKRGGWAAAATLHAGSGAGGGCGRRKCCGRHLPGLCAWPAQLPGAWGTSRGCAWTAPSAQLLAEQQAPPAVVASLAAASLSCWTGGSATPRWRRWVFPCFAHIFLVLPSDAWPGMYAAEQRQRQRGGQPRGPCRTAAQRPRSSSTRSPSFLLHTPQPAGRSSSASSVMLASRWAPLLRPDRQRAVGAPAGGAAPALAPASSGSVCSVPLQYLHFDPLRLSCIVLAPYNRHLLHVVTNPPAAGCGSSQSGQRPAPLTAQPAAPASRRCAPRRPSAASRPT
jgi:hypothetical protein